MVLIKELIHSEFFEAVFTEDPCASMREVFLEPSTSVASTRQTVISIINEAEIK